MSEQKNSRAAGRPRRGCGGKVTTTSEIGHFKNAITPDADTFRDSLDTIEEDLKDHKEDKKLVMYCTGGIRCEKASAYYKHKGFKNVHQPEGGIIEYTRQVKADKLENKFMGKNFVFGL